MHKIWSVSVLVFVLVFDCLTGLRAENLSTDNRPSFDCSHPNELENAICTDPKLASEDRLMAKLYAAARLETIGSLPSKESDLQRKWIAKRDRKCGNGKWKESGYDNLPACLLSFYQRRNENLAAASLLKDHDTAIAALKQSQPNAIPLYEIIYQYLTLDDAAKRSSAFAEKLKPLYDAANTGGYPISSMGLKNLADAVTSDKNFGIFVDLASREVTDGNNLPLPCSIFVRSPVLYSSIGSAKFGSTMDNFGPEFVECDAIMPDLPTDVSLAIKHAIDAEPECKGTIRYAAAKDMQGLIQSVRMHDLGEIKISASDKGKSTIFTNDTVKSLATYYREIFKVSPEQADKDAKLAITALIRAIHDPCDMGNP